MLLLSLRGTTKLWCLWGAFIHLFFDCSNVHRTLLLKAAGRCFAFRPKRFCSCFAFNSADDSSLEPKTLMWPGWVGICMETCPKMCQFNWISQKIIEGIFKNKGNVLPIFIQPGFLLVCSFFKLISDKVGRTTYFFFFLDLGFPCATWGA